jgi:hypothetical protein
MNAPVTLCTTEPTGLSPSTLLKAASWQSRRAAEILAKRPRDAVGLDLQARAKQLREEAGS